MRAASLLLVFWLATAAARAEVTFYVPHSELVASTRTIGLWPVEVDAAVPNADEFAGVLEQNIIARLQRSGFTVVPPGAMREISARGQTSLGGIYDPFSGVLIPERMRALQEFSAEEYRTRYPVDATLHVAVVRRSATFVAGAAEWDGVRERVSSAGAATAALQAIFSARSINSEVKALSLALKLIDSHGETLYTGVGGLLTLAYPTLTGTVDRYDLEASGPKSGLHDPSVVERALAVAFDPLTTGVRSGTQAFTLPPPAAPSSPAPITTKDLLAHHRRLVLAALELPRPALEQGERVQARYRELLAAKLAGLGFEVIAGSEFDGLWAAERAAAGGFYDRTTGRADAAKLGAARAHVLAAFRERGGATAIVLPAIVARAAQCSQGYAKWDGASEPVSGGGSLFFNKSIFNTGLAYGGDRDAFSLEIRIIDDSGTVLFRGIGGLQLASHMMRGDLVQVSEPSLFANASSDSLAVARAMQALVPEHR